MRFFLFLTTLILSSMSLAQNVDFDKYETLRSEAPVPEIITNSLSETIQERKGERINGVGYYDSQQYFEDINTSLKELFNSGLVLFNDPVSDYVTEVGKKIVANNSDLNDIQFFTMRTNVVNAFVTPQGNIFVTQGLIAQLENEAQLAYILAHEIAHYELEHNLEKFKERVSIMRDGGSYSRRIKKLSTYSKDKEYAADSLGIHYYHEANYGKDELNSVFDVLSYSYLPFDLVAFPKDYFNTEKLFVPEEFFTTETPKISFDEDYDDSKSSHPNIESRRDHVAKWMGQYSSWGKDVDVYKLSVEKFIEIRDITRFEAIRNDLYDVKPDNAIYNIFLLEQKYPESEYLRVSKAKAWSQIISLRNEGKFFKQLTSPKKVQGEPYVLAKFLRDLDRESLYTIALRNVYDVKSMYPENDDVKELYGFVLMELARTDEFKPEMYKQKTYLEAKDDFVEARDSLKILDSLKATNDSIGVAEKVDEGVSKYDKIRSKNDTEEVTSVTDSFDVSQFYLYGLSDIVDSSFIAEFEEYEKSVEEERNREEEYTNLRSREKAKLRKEFQRHGMQRGISDLVMIAPQVLLRNKSGDRKVLRSVSAEEYIMEEFENSAELEGIDVQLLSSSDSGISNIEFIRGQNTAINAIRFMSNLEDVNLYPIDRDRLIHFKKTHGSSNLGLFLVDNYKNRMLDISMILTFYIPPLFIYQLTNNAFKANELEYTFVLFDLSIDEFGLEAVHSINLHGSRSKKTIFSMLTYYLNELPKDYE